MTLYDGFQNVWCLVKTVVEKLQALEGGPDEQQTDLQVEGLLACVARNAKAIVCLEHKDS
jgi:hypothetical protein